MRALALAVVLVLSGAQGVAADGMEDVAFFSEVLESVNEDFMSAEAHYEAVTALANYNPTDGCFTTWSLQLGYMAATYLMIETDSLTLDKVDAFQWMLDDWSVAIVECVVAE